MYCMNCGVRLGPGEQRCPLCGLRAVHPDLPPQQGEPLYPPSGRLSSQSAAACGSCSLPCAWWALRCAYRWT